LKSLAPKKNNGTIKNKSLQEEINFTQNYEV
jgi:hypothetical protein